MTENFQYIGSTLNEIICRDHYNTNHCDRQSG